MYLPWFHLEAKGTKWDGLRASVTLSFSPPWATQSPMCSQQPQLHTPVLCIPLYITFSLCSECLYTGFFSFSHHHLILDPDFSPTLFSYSTKYRLLITNHQLCRIPYSTFLIICMQNCCILFERWNPEGCT